MNSQDSLGVAIYLYCRSYFLGAIAALLLSACGGLESGVADLSSQDPFCKVKPLAASKTQRLNGYSTSEKIISFSSDGFTAMATADERDYLALYDRNCLEEPNVKIQSAVFKDYLSARRQRFQAESVRLSQADVVAIRAELFEDSCLVAFAPNQRLQSASPSVRAQVDTSGEPRLSEQSHLNKLGAEDLWSFVYQQPLYQQKVVVGVVDSGINLTHEDLTDQLWESPAGAKGRNFVNPGLTAQDDNGHGSHVAGLIGASGTNGRGGSGVAPAGVQLMALKALDADGGGDLSAVVNAINFAVENGAQVLNLSLGAPGNNAVLRATIEQAVQSGVLVVAATGNDGIEITEANPFSPAMFARDIDGFINVGSVDSATGLRSVFSNFSSSYVEVAAPGAEAGVSGLLSTVGVGSYGTYARMAGTSMAAPLVAGAAAMIIRAFKEHGVQASPAQVEALILRYSRRRSDLRSFVAEGRSLDLTMLQQGLRQELGASSCP